MQKALTLIGDDLRRVEEQFKKDLESNVPLIRKVGEYVLSSGGKRIRPALLILSSRLCGYEGEGHIPLASVVEFIHTATLLHDDVVDEATLRRGLASANTIWGNSASVLVGDFLFSKSFSLMVEHGSLRVLKALSDATTIIAEGEVLQLLCTSDMTMTEERYIQVVTCKTAVLLSAACRVGAILGEVDPSREDALAFFGMNLGIAFQIVDDTLDYVAREEEFGKSIGHDLQEGKLTLPLIHALSSCSEQERELVSSVIVKDELADEDFRAVFSIVEGHGGIDYSLARARDYVSRARESLHRFPDSPVREALLELSDYVVTRVK
ncbi:MAG: polyprenyl synthetase family protein [Desulfuromonadia bacterium]